MSAHSQPQAPTEASDVLDGQAVELATGAELAPMVPPRNAIISAEEPTEVLTKAGTIAAALKDLIKKQHLSLKVKGGEHVEIGGWQALGALVGTLGGTPLHADTRWGPRRVPDSDIEEYEACVEIRTLEDVLVGSAVGSCSRAESNWRDRDAYAVRSMAETRAESRAYRRAVGWLVAIAGYSTTPAEEMPADGGAELSGQQRELIRRALERPFGPAFEPKDENERQSATWALKCLVVEYDARQIWEDLKRRHGYIPQCAIDLILQLAKSVSATEEATV